MNPGLNISVDDEKSNGANLEISPIISNEPETFQSISKNTKASLLQSMVLANYQHYPL